MNKFACLRYGIQKKSTSKIHETEKQIRYVYYYSQLTTKYEKVYSQERQITTHKHELLYFFAKESKKNNASFASRESKKKYSPDLVIVCSLIFLKFNRMVSRTNATVPSPSAEAPTEAVSLDSVVGDCSRTQRRLLRTQQDDRS